MTAPKKDVTRREFIGGLAATGTVGTWLLPSIAAGGNLPLIKPQPLLKGDTVGVVTPASPVFEPSEILDGVHALEKLGFKVRLGRNVGKKWTYLAGTDEERARDLMDMFLDPEIKAIMALRGGYGTIRILPHLDYSLIRQHAKILIGLSDITSLHLAIHKLAGIVTFHGAVATSSFNEYAVRHLFKTLGGEEKVEIEDSPTAFPQTILPENSPATVRGPLTGGNLTLVVATLGTPYELDTAGRVFFLEEVGEEPYRLDRMFTQLDQAGKLRNAAAILVDRCSRCKPAEYKPAFENTLSIEEVILDRLGGLGVPVLYGLTFGHVADKPVLPLGIPAVVDLQRKKIIIDQPAVCWK